MAPEAPSGVHIRGGAPDQTAYLLDGIPVFSPYHAAGTFSAWNPDALDRLQVLATTPSLAPTDALAGAVAAATRAPGTELRSQGTLSTSHGRRDSARPARNLRRGLPAERAVGIPRNRRAPG